MFERYTEKARRAIFFARYEASVFGSPYIESEHLLLGVLREDKALASRLGLSATEIESIRKETEARTTNRERISTSVDLPLSAESKHVLSHAAEEADSGGNREIGTPHLLLGLFREEQSFAARLLRQRGLSLEAVREELQTSEIPGMPLRSAFTTSLDRWLAGLEKRGGVWSAKLDRVGNSTPYFAIYVGDKPNENPLEADPAAIMQQTRDRIAVLLKDLENAIAHHEFEKARYYSAEESKERENLRLLREQYPLQESPPRVPLLCVEVIRSDRFSAVQKRCHEYIEQGVAHVWVLDPNLARAFTVTKTEGLREFKDTVLRIADPLIEMTLAEIFE